MRKLNFLNIEYFLKVAETLNFTVAARELYISQPALSKQIRLLEEELGFKLFLRDTKQVELTEGGKILYEEWKDMILRSEKAIGAAKNASERRLKRIRVGILEFEGVLHKIAPLMEAFTEADNRMEVIYEIHGFSQLRRMLDTDEVDLIFSLNSEVPADKKNIYTQALYDMELCIIVPRKNHLFARRELKVSDLKDETFYIFSDAYSDEARSSIRAHCAREGVAMHKIMEFPNIRSMEIALSNGSGVTLGYRSFFSLTEKLKFFPIQDEIGMHQLVAAWKVEQEQLVHELLEFCSDHMESGDV